MITGDQLSVINTVIPTFTYIISLSIINNGISIYPYIKETGCPSVFPKDLANC